MASLPYVYVPRGPKRVERLVEQEMMQRKEEGYDVTEVEKRFLEADRKSILELKDLLKALEETSLRPDFIYKEPPDLEGIKAERPEKPEKIGADLSDKELYDKIHGGWLGRCAGCLLGKPVEGDKKEQIEQWLKVADAYPLKNYFPPLPSLPEDAPDWLRRIRSRQTKSKVLLGQIDRMARDDDIDYTILGLHILERHGLDFTTMNVGDSWLLLLPFRRVHTAERVAYTNLVNGIFPPETATYMNPYREWIGAQIRADMWGYVNPGMPQLAAEFAYRDGRLSHVKNGVYGEMFVSAMISAAFTTNNIESIIRTGLSVIPKNSRLAEAVRDVLSWSKECSRWEDAWSKVMEKYGHYHPVHTINNAAMVLLGLLCGEGDYERSITISVMSGLDTDCNGATTGSILGVMVGADALPDKWVKPLNDQVESYVLGYNNSRISNLAERTLKQAKSS